MRRGVAAALLLVAWTAAVGTRAEMPWDLPPGVPPPVVPDLSTLTPARIQLGRELFYDTRLSTNGTQSCGTCHRRDFAFTDQKARAIGATGQLHPRGSMSLINVAYRNTLTWADPSMTSLEEQALVPMFGDHPIELGLKGQEPALHKRLAGDVIYLRLFAESFPGEGSPITTANIVAAIAAFERTIVSFRSPYDKYRYSGDTGAMSPAALRGEKIFFSRGKAGCVQCHGGLNFDGGVRTAARVDPPVFHNTGLFLRYPSSSVGLQEHTTDPRDEGKFRAPTLRNVARTAPYMHDGSLSTLAEVIDHYARGGRAPHTSLSPLLRPFTLTPQERDDLIAFLDSLTDLDALVDSRWFDPTRTKYE